MVTSDFRLDVQIWLYHACAMKNMLHNPCLVAESPNFYTYSLVIVDSAMEQIFHVVLFLVVK